MSGPPPTADDSQVPARRYIAFLAMVFGMFMAILDIQVVSASLATIQAGLSASADEVAWVQTAYLVAEVVMIPLSGFLSRAFSTRITFTVSAVGFTLMSLLCSFSTDISQLIVWRALQGFIGGAMIPTVFAAAYSIFPRRKTSTIAAIIGLVATLAPTIGPTVGGYLTDLFSWRWLFLINVAPGIAVAVTAWLLIDFDRPDTRLLRDFDWFGLVSMALFLGALEYLLEEGPAKNWFDDGRIVWAAAISSFGRPGLFRPSLRHGKSDRGPEGLRRPQFLDGLSGLLRLGERALRPDLCLSDLSRPGARLLRPADRRNHVRHRPVPVHRGADRRASAHPDRFAADDRPRLSRFRLGRGDFRRGD